jgi:AraC-like DNA-binding protein
LARQVVNAAGPCPHFESTLAAERLSADLLVLISSILGQRPACTAVHKGRPAIPRLEIIRRCQQFLEEHERYPLKTIDLAGVADVSARTLRRAFKEYYGVTPNSFLLIRQLNRAHRALKAAKSDETNTSDILFDNGVYDLGRFAARYRQLFGELPSETLKASSKNRR